MLNIFKKLSIQQNKQHCEKEHVTNDIPLQTTSPALPKCISKKAKLRQRKQLWYQRNKERIAKIYKEKTKVKTILKENKLLIKTHNKNPNAYLKYLQKQNTNYHYNHRSKNEPILTVNVNERILGKRLFF